MSTMDTLHDPASDGRMTACPECHALGTIDGRECGVCIGDRFVWFEGEEPYAGITIYIDHSSYDHQCERCQPRQEPPHLRPETSQRGFAQYPPIVDSYQSERVRVYESSAASEPHIWLSIEALVAAADEPAPPRKAHLTLEQATQLAEQINHAIEHHYGDA